MPSNTHVNSNKIWGYLARIGLPLLALFMVISLVRNASLLFLAQRRLSEAQDRLKEDQMNVDEAKDKLSQVQSVYYEEKVIRDKLGLAKEGETVFVLPEDEVLKNLSPRVEHAKEYSLPDPNWKKWLKLFN